MGFLFFSPSSAPNSDKVSEYDSSRSQKASFLLQSPSNCSLERVLILSPPATSHSQRTPKPRGALTVLESNSCRDCASTLSTPAWSMKVTKPKPLRRVVRERQMVTRAVSGRGGRGEPSGKGRFQRLTWIFWSGGRASPDTPSPPRTGRSIRAALL